MPQNDESQLVHANMALVGHIVRETMSRVPAHVSRDDLTSAGFVALVQSAKSFDAEQGVPFARYAARRIRGAILDELRGIDWASRSVRRRARELERTRNELAVALKRVPTLDEIAQVMGVSTREILANDSDVARADLIALSGPAGAALEQRPAHHGPTPEEMVEHREQLEYLVDSIAELPERLRKVVEDYFISERPMAEIAKELGVTESRVSQMRAEALKLIRTAMTRALDPESALVAGRSGSAARRVDAYVTAVTARHAAVRPSRRTQVTA